MTPPPAQPKIYHITHVDNLPGIIADGALVSDAAMMARGGPVAPIGMSSIKMRRVHELEVHSHPGSRVGEYVPFFFCPRSIMLFVIHRANHPELTYRGGQGPIVHLEADLQEVVAVGRWPGAALGVQPLECRRRLHRVPRPDRPTRRGELGGGLRD